MCRAISVDVLISFRQRSTFVYRGHLTHIASPEPPYLLVRSLQVVCLEVVCLYRLCVWETSCLSVRSFSKTVRDACVSRHNGGPIQGPPLNPSIRSYAYCFARASLSACSIFTGCVATVAYWSEAFSKTVRDTSVSRHNTGPIQGPLP